MAQELKATVVNMKHLSQDIADPIVNGGGDVNGRTLRVIFTQEAAAQITPDTKVYLSWMHQEKKIKGYNIFTEITDEDDEDFPPTWEIHYPRAMLHEGNVLACIQLVDEVSIATSVNFTIHILSDPNDGSDYELSDDYSDFQKMVIRISCLEKQMKDQMEAQKIEFEDMQLIFQRIEATANDAEAIAREAKEKAEEALNITSGYEEAIQHLQETVDGLKDFTEDIEQAKQEAQSYTDDALTVLEF